MNKQCIPFQSQGSIAVQGRVRRSILKIISISTCLSCGSLRTANLADSEYIIEPQGNSVFLQVFTSEGVPLPLASVSLANQYYASNAAGQVVLDNLQPGELTAIVYAEGYAPSHLTLEIHKDAHIGTAVYLLPLGAAREITIIPNQATKIQQGSICLTIPPGSLVQGVTDIAGTIEAHILPIPSDLLPKLIPAPTHGIHTKDDVSINKNFTAQNMTYIQLTKSGQPVYFGPGKTATLEILLPASIADVVNVGDEIPVWWLGQDHPQWIQTNEGTVVNDSSCKTSGSIGKLVLSVEINAFAWWSSGFIWDESQCVQVNVVNDIQIPEANVQVFARVADEATIFQTSTYTDIAGSTCLEVPNEQISEIFIGPFGQIFGESQPIEPSKSSATCENPAACKHVQVTIPSSTPIVCSPGSLLVCLGEDEEDNAILKSLQPSQANCQENTFLCNASGTGWLDCTNQVWPTDGVCSPS